MTTQRDLGTALITSPSGLRRAMNISTISTAAALLLAAGTAHADELRPIQAGRFELGSVLGVAYYTVEPDGLHVVATLADGPSTPVRVQLVLASDESVVLSTPGPLGSLPESVVLTRRGDSLAVHPAAALLD